jgi:predicted ATPase/class 3 adenylate cyclase
MNSPISTYTFLFTDIEGSTGYWERQPDKMRPALERHNRILRQAIESHAGWVFRTAGDAYFASFQTASDALAAAVAAQRQLFAQDWDLDSPLRVRMALHTGEAEEREGDYVGASLNRIGRLIAVCHGGQTLLSLATQELVRDNLPEEVGLLDLGRHRFRDMIHPERIFQVSIDGLPDDFPPLKSLEATPNNLPTQLTSFIGREAELAKAQELLSSGRLLTLTGPGGTGKTRLALQVAACMIEDFPDGVWLVELAPLADQDLVLQSIAAVLNVRDHPERPLQQSIVEALRNRKLLLLLDNCEHLIEACTMITDALLRSGPDLKVLVSSREVLGIGGELTMRVPPLSLPQHSSDSLEELQASEAVQLFLDRARAIEPTFSLTGQNAAAIAKICQRLDGIPLAIELAAARVRLLNPEQIAARLDNLFRLLTGGSRAALPRQQTLEAMIDWSHDLLSEAERTLFRRLSVFSAGWTFEATEVVCIGDGQDQTAGDLPPLDGDVLDLLAQLVNKSLVLVDDQGLITRYRLLETIRQYAQNKLVESGEASAVRHEHLQFFKEFSAEAFQGLMGTDQSSWMERLEKDHDNLRAALDWALEHDLLAALEIGANLGYFWNSRGYASEGRRWIQAGLNRLGKLKQPPEDQRLRGIEGRALSSYGQMAIIQGDYAAARQALERSVQIQRELEEPQELVFSIALLSLANLFLVDIAQSQSLAEEGVSMGRQLDDPIGLALSLSILAQINVRMPGGYPLAREQIQESASLLRAHGNRWFSALSLMGLGIVAYVARDLDNAASHFEESMQIFQEAGDLHFTNASRSYLVDVVRLRGELDQAAVMYREILETWLRLGHRGGFARCLECLAFIAMERAFRDHAQDREKLVMQAGAFLGAAESIRSESGARMTIDEQMEYSEQMNALRAELGENPAFQDAFERALDEGRQADPYQLLDRFPD